MSRSMLIALLATVFLWQPKSALGQHGYLAHGKELFTHDWTVNDPLSVGGDGLGPLFNATSCVECHQLGGIGGAGAIEHNVDLLSTESATTGTAQQLLKFHPGFAGEDFASPLTSIVLHRFSQHPDYSSQRKQTIGDLTGELAIPSNTRRMQRLVELQPLQKVPTKRRLNIVRSQRNSQALFGVALINQISSDQLIDMATRSVQQFGDQAGRIPAITNSEGVMIGIGRFGWRGQSQSLGGFVSEACAIELGLETNAKAQSPDPNEPKYRPNAIDMTDQQTRQLTAFVASLPAPQQVLPATPEGRMKVAHGQQMFNSTGCANCHVKSIGNVQDLYSDMLLHDMGDSLADPVAASTPVPLETIRSAQFVELTSRIPRSAGGYYAPPPPTDLVDLRGPQKGETLADVRRRRLQNERLLATAKREWRTPPLWGVADSAPYLHDGRAQTLVEAIAAHGGQARQSMGRFFASPIDDRLAIIDFLNTLKAPK